MASSIHNHYHGYSTVAVEQGSHEENPPAKSVINPPQASSSPLSAFLAKQLTSLYSRPFDLRSNHFNENPDSGWLEAIEKGVNNEQFLQKINEYIKTLCIQAEYIEEFRVQSKNGNFCPPATIIQELLLQAVKFNNRDVAVHLIQLCSSSQISLRDFGSTRTGRLLLEQMALSPEVARAILDEAARQGLTYFCEEFVGCLKPVSPEQVQPTVSLAPSAKSEWHAFISRNLTKLYLRPVNLDGGAFSASPYSGWMDVIRENISTPEFKDKITQYMNLLPSREGVRPATMDILLQEAVRCNNRDIAVHLIQLCGSLNLNLKGFGSKMAGRLLLEKRALSPEVARAILDELARQRRIQVCEEFVEFLAKHPNRARAFYEANPDYAVPDKTDDCIPSLPPQMFIPTLIENRQVDAVKTDYPRNLPEMWQSAAINPSQPVHIFLRLILPLQQQILSYLRGSDLKQFACSHFFFYTIIFDMQKRSMHRNIRNIFKAVTQEIQENAAKYLPEDLDIPQPPHGISRRQHNPDYWVYWEAFHRDHLLISMRNFAKRIAGAGNLNEQNSSYYRLRKLTTYNWSLQVGASVRTQVENQWRAKCSPVFFEWGPLVISNLPRPEEILTFSTKQETALFAPFSLEYSATITSLFLCVEKEIELKRVNWHRYAVFYLHFIHCRCFSELELQDRKILNALRERSFSQGDLLSHQNLYCIGLHILARAKVLNMHEALSYLNKLLNNPYFREAIESVVPFLQKELFRIEIERLNQKLSPLPEGSTERENSSPFFALVAPPPKGTTVRQRVIQEMEEQDSCYQFYLKQPDFESLRALMEQINKDVQHRALFIQFLHLNREKFSPPEYPPFLVDFLIDYVCRAVVFD